MTTPLAKLDVGFCGKDDDSRRGYSQLGPRAFLTSDKRLSSERPRAVIQLTPTHAGNQICSTIAHI
jgi:hypothetical protein